MRVRSRWVAPALEEVMVLLCLFVLVSAGVAVGRKGEGEEWCEFERALGGIAWRVEEEERAREAWRVAEEEKRARVQMHARAHRREVVEID